MQAAKNSPPITVPNKGAYMMSDMMRWAKRYGVEMRPNEHFPVNTLHAMRVAVAAVEDPKFPSLHQALFRAVWMEGKNLGDKDVLAAVVDAAGLDGAALLARAGEQETKDTLRRNREEAVDRGAVGAPTLFVGKAMFWGNDRFELVEDALRAAA